MSVHNFEVRLEERLRKKAFAHYDWHSMIVDYECPSKYLVLEERRNTTTGASAASLVSEYQNNLLKNKQIDYQQQCDAQPQQNLLYNNNSTNSNNNIINIGSNNINNNSRIYSNNNFKNHFSNDKSSNGNQIEHKNTSDTNNRNSVNGTHKEDLPDLGDGRENDLVLACPFFRNELGGEEERIVCLNKLTDRRQITSTAELHKPSFVAGISVLESTYCPMKSICPYQRNLQCNPVIDFHDQGAFYYREYFFGRDHQNWIGHSESYGPLAISIRKEAANSTSRNVNEVKYRYRIIIRTSELAVLRGSIYEDCIPNLTHRTSSKEVLEYLLAKSDIPLNKLKLGNAEAEAHLLKLDEFKLTKNYKVGVLYCKAGQSTEEEFYNNEHSGPLFEEFLSCIGENVRLLEFKKYRGGLDITSDSTGLYSVHTTYNSCEIMFHVSTMLPYSASNRQQLSRKRHIGNDIVTVVFQEEGALPFTPKTVRSQFQHVFIIVRAFNPPLLPDGSFDFSVPRHYAVAVSRSKQIPPFGPPIPETGIFVKSPQFKNFLLAKIINAENAAHKYCEKFTEMDQRARLGEVPPIPSDCCGEV